MAAGQYGMGWIVTLGFMEAFVLAAGLLALWEPNAAGGYVRDIATRSVRSGVAEVISFLNGARPLNLLSYTTFICKSIGITLAVAAGVFLGYAPLSSWCD